MAPIIFFATRRIIRVTNQRETGRQREAERDRDRQTDRDRDRQGIGQPKKIKK